MKRKTILLLTIAGTITLLSSTAFALDESEVQSAIAASSETEVAGNIFIWLLCAVAFLKISQKIDSFLAGLGVNVGRTGGSMLAELMVAGRAIGTAAGAAGGALGGIFNRGHSNVTNNTQAAGQAFTGGGSGLAGIAMRAVGNAAAASATGRGSGLGSVIGGAAYAASAKSGGNFASDVVGAVATGNIAKVGSMTGDRASSALTSYLGFGAGSAVAGAVSGRSPVPGSAANFSSSGVGSPTGVPGGGIGTSPFVVGESDPEDSETPISSVGGGQVPPSESIPMSPGDTVVTEDGGSVGGDADYISGGAAEPASADSIPAQPPTFTDVEIGGGRITGYETPAGGGDARQFTMYHASQYMEPSDTYEKVQTTDGESWYKQYAQPTVKKTPFEESGKIQYHEEIVQKMPQAPKRKDKV
jgi:hypothetical protein